MNHALSMLRVAIAALAAVGCATARIDSTRGLVSEDEILRPPILSVYDFAVTKTDVVVDQLGPEFATSDGTKDEQDALAKQVASALAEAIVEELREREIEAEHASRGMRSQMNALLLKGAFLSIDEGDQMGRVTIGFGVGKSAVRVRAQVFQQTEWGAKIVKVGTAQAAGSRMPGILSGPAIVAPLGSAATSAIVAGSMTSVREVRGPLAQDVARLAKEIAERVEAFYERQRWL